MDRYAVIGQPIAHSQSPRIHTLFAAQTAQTLHYSAIEIVPGALVARLADLYQQGYLGLNVTLPHKVAVMAQCHTLSDRAQRAGAVNTLIRSERGWRGDNTDGEGCLHDLQRLGFALRDRRLLVLGAGGATRGILEPLLSAQPAQLVVANRSVAKAQQLAQDFAPLGAIQACALTALGADAFDLVINATSAGHSGGLAALPSGLLARGGDAYDLSYGPAFVPFEAWARAQNAARISDGLGMLVGQAAAAFMLWRGVDPQVAPVLTTLRG